MQASDINAPFPLRLSRLLAASGATSLSSPSFASYLDTLDPLSHLRAEFNFPKRSTVWPEEYRAERQAQGKGGEEEDRREAVYLAGNSLGLMPKRTSEMLTEELNVWSSSGVLGHMDHFYGRPWVKIDEHVTPYLAELVGAKESEVACMGSLTGNLHTLLTSFYQPTEKRHKILYEGKAFPSDAYAFASHVALHSYPPSSLLPIYPREGEYTLRTEDILAVLEEQGDEIAVVCFGAVQYYSGEWFEMEKITKAGQAKGCLVGWDCAHATGNVPLKLHDWGVDFACWCSYKYLNSGPGGIAGLFVHERWEERKRLQGWWGHSKSTRFSMPSEFSPLPGAAGWQFSNPSVLDVVSLLSSLQLFREASRVLPRAKRGGNISEEYGPILGSLREKSMELTGYLEVLLKSSGYYVETEKFSAAFAAREDEAASSTTPLRPTFTIITPSSPSLRGAQLSLLFSPVSTMDPVFTALRTRGILGDERRPGVIRFAPVPMYCSFGDVREATEGLEEAMGEWRGWEREEQGGEGGKKVGEQVRVVAEEEVGVEV